MFYPNLHMSALMPQVIGIFTSLFKREGYTLDLFDCTFYQDIDVINIGKNANEERVKNRKTSYNLYLACLIWYFQLKNFLRPHSSIGRATDL